MVMTEHESGHSIFAALRHARRFAARFPTGSTSGADWQLIAPQVALLGPDAFTVLALFAYALVGTSLFLLSAAIVISAWSLSVPLGAVFHGALETDDARCIDAQHARLRSDRAGRSQG
jgi:hypothetical protein